MIVRAAFIFIGAMAVAVAADPRRDEFAYEAPVALAGEGTLYRAPVTAAVYQGVTRSDLGDLRVYNGAGEMVPHGVERPVIEPIRNVARLPVFPLSLGRDPAARDMSLHVEVGRGGSIVKVQDGDGEAAADPVHLLDISRIEQPLAALEVEWEDQGGGGAIRTVKVEASDDLKSWRPVGQGALAKLTHAGQALERKRIEFPAQRMTYARLVWADPSSPPSVTSVKGEFTSTAEIPRDWLVPERDAAAGERRGQRFRLNGVMPVDRARLILPPNSVARVSVLYRRKDGDPWVRAGEKTVYSLETTSGALEDNEIRFLYGVYASQWLLQIGGRSAAAHGRIGLALGWVPHELTFIARGAPPFTVAYGLAGLAPIDFGVNQLKQLVKRENQALVMGQAVLGASRELKGERARSGTWSLSDWKHVLLWAVLLGGVGSLAVFAVRLGRQLRSEP